MISPLRRDMRITFERREGRSYKARILCERCDARFDYESPWEDGIAAKCKMEDDFLKKLARRTRVIVDILERRRDEPDGDFWPNCLADYCERHGLDPKDPASMEKLKADIDFVHKEMDVLFDDAENFLAMAENGDGLVFGYAVFGERAAFEEGAGKDTKLILAYRGTDYIAALPLDSDADREIAAELVKVCRNGTRMRGDVRFHDVVKKMISVEERDFFEDSHALYPIENEISRERPFSDEMGLGAKAKRGPSPR